MCEMTLFLLHLIKSTYKFVSWYMQCIEECRARHDSTTLEYCGCMMLDGILKSKTWL
jgi:hypothetical protein